MGYFLFIDESGQDHNNSGYEVLAGIAVKDSQVWQIIQFLHMLENKHFGMRISNGKLELKGKKLLKRKVFRLANQLEQLSDNERSQLAKKCIEKGNESAQPTREELTALCQSKIAFVKDILILCAQNRIKAFASIVNNSAPRLDDRTMLRKDYAFLFERYFYFLEDISENTMGSIVFDELEKSKSHILVDQIEEYFLKTTTGKERASHIIPEPFFVHSDLTTLIQVADIIAYIISWGVQICSMNPARRDDLIEFGKQVLPLRYSTRRESQEGENFTIWSFKVFDDLRPSSERF